MSALIYQFQDLEHRFDLRERATIGRTEDNDLCLPSPSVSSHHALIVRDGAGFQLVDQDSANGILVDGRKVPSLLLQDRAEFSLGDVHFLFLAQDAQEPPAPAEPAAARPAPLTAPPPALPESVSLPSASPTAASPPPTPPLPEIGRAHV